MAHRNLTASASRLYNIFGSAVFSLARISCSEQSSFHGQAFDRAWSFRSSPFKTSRRKKVLRPDPPHPAPRRVTVFWLPPRITYVSSDQLLLISHFFVADTWGKSAVIRQDQGLRQGDPLACFFSFDSNDSHYARRKSNTFRGMRSQIV